MVEKFNSFEDLGVVKDQLKDKEDKEINDFKKEALKNMKPFIEEAIQSGKLDFSYGNHGHLNYSDEKFWGHYISPTEDGVVVTVYLKNEIKGNPMDIDGKRGRSFNLNVPLDVNFRQKMVEIIKTSIDKEKKQEENEKGTEKGKSAQIASARAEFLDGSDDILSRLENGLNKN